MKCQALPPSTQRTGDTKPASGAVQTAVTEKGQRIWEAGPTWVRQDALRPVLEILAMARG